MACGFNVTSNFIELTVFALITASILGRWVWRYAGLRSTSSVVRVSWTADEICCYLRNGQQINGKLSSRSSFNPALINLHITTHEGRHFWWPLMADSGPIDGLRKLRGFGRCHEQNVNASQS